MPARSPEVATDNPVFVPPFLGSKVVKGISIDEIAGFVNETALFRNQWQFRPEVLPDGTKEDDEQFKDRIRPILREQLADAKAAGLLIPQVVYGYFAANADGDDLVLFTDDTRDDRAGPVLASPASRPSRSCASPTSSDRSTASTVAPARSTTRRSTS